MKRISPVLALAVVAMVAHNVSARPPRFASRTPSMQQPSSGSNIHQAFYPTPEIPPERVVADTTPPVSGAQEALDEVNAARAARGLPPYVRDPGLTQAAMTIAVQRASTLTQGHSSNDFAGLPPGSTASASGCAAWPASMGWGSCCTYDRYTYAGAAWAIGRDGRRYMQLFVR